MMRSQGVLRVLFTLLSLLLGAFGCSGPDAGSQPSTAKVTQAVLSAADKAVLGFESLDDGEWTPSASSTSLSLASRSTEGRRALRVASSSWVRITSVPVTTPWPDLLGTMSLDLMAENNTGTTWGTVQIYVDVQSPNGNIYHRNVGQIGVFTLPEGTYKRLRLNPGGADFAHALAHANARLTFKLDVNLPPGVVVYLDRLSLTGNFEPLNERQSYGFTLTTPGNPADSAFGWHEVGALAMGEMRINDGVELRLGTGVVGTARVANVGRIGGRLGVEAEVGDLWSVGSVDVASRAIIHGDTFLEGQLRLQDGTSRVEGTLHEGTSVRPFTSERLRVSFPGELEGDKSIFYETPVGERTLVPDRTYGSVHVYTNGTVILEPGNYYVRDLIFESYSFAQLRNEDGPIVIHVSDNLIFRGTAQQQDYGADNVAVIYLGPADVGIEGRLDATIMAPNAKLWTTGGILIRGAFIARDLEFHQNGWLYQAPFDPGDCSDHLAACRRVPGCQLLDSDGDTLADCEELADRDAWTDPQVFNGAETSLTEGCAAISDCTAFAHRSTVDTCTEAGVLELHDSYSGWSFRDLRGTEAPPNGFSPCDPEYDFGPPWAGCEPGLWGVRSRAQMKIERSGLHCFELTGAENGGCGSFFFDGEDSGLLSGEGPRCFDVPAGVYPVEWFYRSTSGPRRALELLYCAGGGEECTPRVPLQQELLRTEFFGDEDLCDPGHPCSDLCPCASCSPCDSGDDCDEGEVCDAEAAAACGNAGKACWSAICRDDPVEAGCGAENSICGPVCPIDVCASALGECPAGLVAHRELSRFSDCDLLCIPADCLNPAFQAANCGGQGKICKECLCTPDCSTATCANPDDNCGGQCGGVCANGESGCSADVHCGEGLACIRGTCRPVECTVPDLLAALCEAPSSPCGDACPVCTPECGGRECGSDPACGQICGAGCDAGEFCDFNGQCLSPAESEPPLVPDGSGGSLPLAPLDEPVVSTVGAVPGTFGVTEDGLATYNIPIEVPPGRAGMEPALSLQYGGKSDGILGVGWRIEGLSAITRCPRIYALDGYTRPVNGTVGEDGDRFCMDGKTLEAVGGPYGHPGTEYRTLIDSFTRIEPVYLADSTDWTMGPDSFKVWTKDGKIHWYGAEVARSTLRDVRTAWLLNRVEDRSGNTIEYEYERTGSSEGVMDGHIYGDQAIRIERVAYTGHGDAAGTREVRFEYEIRADSNTLFAPFSKAASLLKRMKTITTYVDGAPVKSYVLGYRAETDSLIDTIWECVGVEAGQTPTECKPPTRFEFGEAIGFEFSSSDSTCFPAPGARLDINGDGIQDVLHTEAEKTVRKNRHTGWKRFYDITGIVASAGLGYLTNGGVSAGFSFVWNSVGEAIIFPPEVSVKFERTAGISTGQRSQTHECVEISDNGLSGVGKYPALLVDWDRDGLDDVIVARPRFSRRRSGQFVEGYRLRWHRSWGYGTFDDLGELPIALPTGEVTSPPLIYDVDGDGLEEVLVCDRDGAAASLYLRIYHRNTPRQKLDEAEEWVVRGQGYCSDADKGRKHAILDIDGDGVQNLIAYVGDGNWVSLEKTSTGLPYWRQNVMLETEGASGFKDLHVGDFNRDGLPEIFSTTEEKTVLWRNRGGWLVPRVWAREPHRVKLGDVALMDYDGDGRTDVLEDWKFEVDEDEDWESGSDTQVARQLADISPFRLSPASGLIEYDENGTPFHFDWDEAVDLDGDNQLDLVRDRRQDSRPRFGTGNRGYRLKRVVDGMMKAVEFRYDDAGTYSVDDECKAEWPETCMRHLTGLVSSHTVRYADAPLENPSHRVEYTYRNGRFNLAGHGWLGFDERGERLTIASAPPRSTTIDYGAARRYRPDGALANDAEPPYLYPTVGLVRTVTTRHAHSDSQLALELSGERAEYSTRLTRATNSWGVGISADGRPFPWVVTRHHTISEERGDGQARTIDSFQESFSVDSYGNMTSHSLTTAIGTQMTTTVFVPDRTDWLVANPERVTITARRVGSATQSRQYSMTYADNGLLETVTRDLPDSEPISPAGSPFQRTTYYRDGFGNVTRVATDAAASPGRTTNIQYDSQGLFPVTLTNALGQVTQVRFDERWGAVTALVDPNGVAQQSSFDAFGRRYETRGPSGTTITTLAEATESTVADPWVWEHPVIAITTETADRAGQPGPGQTVEINHLGLPVRKTTVGFDGAAVIETMDYDGEGRLITHNLPRTSSEAAGTETYVYDGAGRVTSVARADGSVWRREYLSSARLSDSRRWWADLPSDAGEVVYTQDASGKVNVTVHGQFGEVRRSIDGDNLAAGGQVSDYEYTAFGVLRSLTSVDGTTRIQESDAYGRVYHTSDPNSGERDYVYNGFDEPLTTETAEGTSSVYYDQLGRVIILIDPDGTSRWEYDSGVNALGKLVRAIAPPTDENPAGVVVEYEYEPVTTNNRGLLSAATLTVGGKSLRTEMTFDGFSRAATVRYPSLGSGAPVIAQYGYDPLSGALSSLDEVGSGTPRQIWQLDAAYQGTAIAQETFGNGAQTSYTYFPDSRMVESIGTTVGGAVVQALAYDYFPNDKVRNKSDSTRGYESHYYDALGRLEGLVRFDANGQHMSDVSYDYQPNGNLTHAVGSRGGGITYDPARPQLVQQVGPNTYGHDSLGRVTSRVGPDITGGAQEIEYTFFDLPRRVVTGLGTDLTTTEYVYTAGGQRVLERNGTEARYSTGQGYEAVFSEVTGALISEHFRLHASGRPVAEIVRDAGGSETVEYIHTDALGSIDALSSEDGTFVRQAWEPFGAVNDAWTDPPAGLETRLGFTGHLDDAGTGLINMQGRIYDPLVGRFLTPDPVVQAPYWSQGHNQYSYVYNDPVNLVDPSGFSARRDTTLGMMAWSIGVTTAAPMFGSAPAWGAGLSSASAMGPAATVGASLAVSMAGTVAGTIAGRMVGGLMAPSYGTFSVPTITPSAMPKAAGAAPSGPAKAQNGPIPSLCDLGCGAGDAAVSKAELWKRALDRLRWENTPQLAAHVFLDKWNPYSVKYDIEFYTVIVERNGEYAAMPAQVGERNSGGGFWQMYHDLKNDLPGDTRLVAWAHTHGKWDSWASESFSQNDRDITQRTGLMGYLATPRENRFKSLNAVTGVETDLGQLPRRFRYQTQTIPGAQ